MRGVRVYRRHLPHWRGDGATYFVTWRLHPIQDDLVAEERSIVVSALRHFDGARYRLHAFVVMNDHVHVLLTPTEGVALEMIGHSWKSFAANCLHAGKSRRGAIWQDEYLDRIVRHEAEFLEKAKYILNNPWKRWPELAEYDWVGHEGDG
jgi:REP element-mobilizing transposase RayT